MADSGTQQAGENPPSAGPGNVYHKQAKTPRSRREPTHRIDSGMPPPPRRAEGNPMKRTLTANVKRFVLFSIAMAILMFVSIRALYVIWAKRDQQIQATTPITVPRTKPEPAQPTPTPTTKETKKPQEAGSELDTEAIRKAVFLARRAKTLEQAGNVTDAIARYREALDVWPYLTQVWAQLGRLYLQTREFSKAQVALEKAVENDPGAADILNDLGVTYLYMGQTAKAMKVFEAAIEIDPNFSPSYFNKALGCLAQGDKASARSYLQRYLQIKNDDPRALRELAFLEASDQKYEEALRLIERAIIAQPDWALLYFDAAASAALMGLTDKSIGYLEKAEPLSSPATIYRLYKEPAFREVRLSTAGKQFESRLADKAREIIAKQGEPPPINNTTEPISSASPSTD